MLGRGAVAGEGVGDAAQRLHQRSKPQGPGCHAGGHWGGRVVAKRQSLWLSKGSIPGPGGAEDKSLSRDTGSSTAVARRAFRKEGRLKVYRHRGLCGANL